jgi:heme/copper-type cytochrome/quinol oxidase subunit 3
VAPLGLGAASDVMRSSESSSRPVRRSPDAGTASRAAGARGASQGTIGMWVFLATDAMGFGGLLLAYGVLRTRAGAWPDPAVRFDRALAGALTFVLLFSGATMTAAVAAARAGERRSARLLLAATALAGLAFVAGQATEFHALATVRHLGLTADHAAALFYVITGYHGLHVLAGVVALTVLGARVSPPRVDADADADAGAGAGPTSDRGWAGALAVLSLYWQFVDLIWIVVFTALYLLPPAVRG